MNSWVECLQAREEGGALNSTHFLGAMEALIAFYRGRGLGGILNPRVECSVHEVNPFYRQEGGKN